MKFLIYIGPYVIQPLAPFKNFKLWFNYSGARVPFIVDTNGFVPYKQGKTYIVKQDGEKGNWFAHDNTFTNVIEDHRISFDSTPQGALMDFMHRFEEEE